MSHPIVVSAPPTAPPAGAQPPPILVAGPWATPPATTTTARTRRAPTKPGRRHRLWILGLMLAAIAVMAGAKYLPMVALAALALLVLLIVLLIAFAVVRAQFRRGRRGGGRSRGPGRGLGFGLGFLRRRSQGGTGGGPRPGRSARLTGNGSSGPGTSGQSPARRTTTRVRGGQPTRRSTGGGGGSTGGGGRGGGGGPTPRAGGGPTGGGSPRPRRNPIHRAARPSAPPPDNSGGGGGGGRTGSPRKSLFRRRPRPAQPTGGGGSPGGGGSTGGGTSGSAKRRLFRRRPSGSGTPTPRQGATGTGQGGRAGAPNATGRAGLVPRTSPPPSSAARPAVKAPARSVNRRTPNTTATTKPATPTTPTTPRKVSLTKPATPTRPVPSGTGRRTGTPPSLLAGHRPTTVAARRHRTPWTPKMPMSTDHDYSGYSPRRRRREESRDRRASQREDYREARRAEQEDRRDLRRQRRWSHREARRDRRRTRWARRRATVAFKAAKARHAVYRRTVTVPARWLWRNAAARPATWTWRNAVRRPAAATWRRCVVPNARRAWRASRAYARRSTAWRPHWWRTMTANPTGHRLRGMFRRLRALAWTPADPSGLLPENPAGPVPDWARPAARPVTPPSGLIPLFRPPGSPGAIIPPQRPGAPLFREPSALDDERDTDVPARPSRPAPPIAPPFGGTNPEGIDVHRNLTHALDALRQYVGSFEPADLDDARAFADSLEEFQTGVAAQFRRLAETYNRNFAGNVADYLSELASGHTHAASAAHGVGISTRRDQNVRMR